MSRRDGSGIPTRGFERWRWILAAGLLGMALGFGWGIEDEPSYRATSTVAIAAAEGDEPDPAAAARFAEIGESREVADVVAGLLGDDVPGADLLADVDVTAASDGLSLRVAARAEQPDFALAAADGYAQALVDVAAESAGKGEVPPLIVGAAASLPDGPSENRSAFAWSLFGLGAGLLIGLLGALILPRRSQSATSIEATPQPAEAPIETSSRPVVAPDGGLGPRVLASTGDPGAALRRTEPGVLALESPAAEPFREAIEGLELNGRDAPRTLAIVPAEPGPEPVLVAIALAAAAAERGLRVLLVEAGSERPAVAAVAEVPGAPGLVDYLDGRAAPRDVLRSLLVSVDGAEPFPLACVPGGDRAGGRPDDLADARLQALTERLPRVYDLVLLLGFPPAGGEGSDVLTAPADGVVLVSGGAQGGERAAAAVGGHFGGVPVLGEILIGE